MKKIIILMMVLVVSAWAEKSNKQFLKIETERFGNTVNLKLLIRSKIIESIEGKKKKEKYVANITAIVGKKVVYDFSPSPFIPRYPRIEFKFKESKYDIVDFYITYSDGEKIQESFKMMHKKKGVSNGVLIKTNSVYSQLSFIPTNSKLWEATTSEEAIKKLYGSVSMIEGKIDFNIPVKILSKKRYFKNANYARIYIKSDLKLESIAIFADWNLRSTIAVFKTNERGVNEYYYSFKLISHCLNSITLTIVGKGKDGKFYKAVSKEIYRVCSDDGDAA